MLACASMHSVLQFDPADHVVLDDESRFPCHRFFQNQNHWVFFVPIRLCATFQPNFMLISVKIPYVSTSDFFYYHFATPDFCTRTYSWGSRQALLVFTMCIHRGYALENIQFNLYEGRIWIRSIRPSYLPQIPLFPRTRWESITNCARAQWMRLLRRGWDLNPRCAGDISRKLPFFQKIMPASDQARALIHSVVTCLAHWTRCMWPCARAFDWDLFARSN